MNQHDDLIGRLVDIDNDFFDEGSSILCLRRRSVPGALQTESRSSARRISED